MAIGQPIIGVSTAYRLGPFGFLNGDEVQGAGQTNLGLKDQRLAMHWLQENIGGFGGTYYSTLITFQTGDADVTGDPNKVTIWGESAGAASVGFHLTAFNGRDDKLFRSAMMESGKLVLHYPTLCHADQLSRQSSILRSFERNRLLPAKIRSASGSSRM